MINKRKIGNTDLEVSELSMGTAPIGGWPIAVSAEKAHHTMEIAWQKGIRYFDTAPLYGSGMAEERLGNFLQSKNRDDYAVATKVGRLVVDTKEANDKFKGQDPYKDTVFDCSYDGAMRSFEESLKRLQLDRVDVLHLHDPDIEPGLIEESKNGAIKAMIKLREEKVVNAIGCGINQNKALVDLAQEECFDCFLLAGRYTLLDQTSLDELIPVCEEKNISLLLGGVLNSGILIHPSPDTYFDYTKLDENWFENATNGPVRIPEDHESADFWLNKAYKLRDVCEEFKISLKRAAIQFPFANSVVASAIIGMNSVLQVEENLEDYNNPIPGEFWKKLKNEKLIDQRAPTP